MSGNTKPKPKMLKSVRNHQNKRQNHQSIQRHFDFFQTEITMDSNE